MKKILATIVSVTMMTQLTAATTLSIVPATKINCEYNFNKTKVDVSKLNLSATDLIQEWSNIKNSTPEIWYLSDTIRIAQSNGKVKIVELKYDYTEKEILEMQAYIDNVVDAAVAVANTFQSDYDKAKSVYDFLIESYDYDWTLSKHREYDLFKTGEGVCTAYSLAYKDIMQKLNIPCEIVISKEIAHQWNIVKINGSWYNVDTAWGDIYTSENESFRYDNFMKSDYYFVLLGHTGGISESIINCQSRKFD